MAPIMVKKQYGFTASVIQGTNNVIGCSKADWSLVKNGSFIVLGDDKTFYRVVDKKRFLFEKEVSVINESRLKIDYNVGALLNIEDEIAFTHTEYEANAVSVSSAGQGYSTGEILRLEGGVCKYNSFDEIDTPCRIEVLETDSDGGITSVGIKNEGIYILPPQSDNNVSGGSGSGCALNTSFKTKEIKPIEERGIENIALSDSHTLIDLNHPLPPRLKSGIIKTEKWELSLAVNYTKESKFNSSYEIIKDFTPNCDLPLMYSDIKSSHMVYNESMSIIDQRLKDIEDKL
jgi:hypothetical protein